MKIFGGLLVIFVSFSTWAYDPGPKFGPEFTFAKPDGSDSRDQRDVVRRVMRRHLIEGQPEGAKFTMAASGFFQSPNGWWLNVGTDQGVVEVGMKPLTVDDFEKYKDDVQDALFVSASNAGLIPSLFMGGGHNNVDFNYFRDKPLLFRNFVVDLYNHSELFMGVWNYDTANSMSLNLMSDDFQKEFFDVIEAFDLAYEDGVPDIEWLVEEINNAVYRHEDPFTDNGGMGIRDKEVSPNLRNVPERDQTLARIELRGFRPQISADVYFRQIRLIRNRLRYLQQWTTPITIGARVEHHADELVELQDFDTPPVDPQEALASFYDYVIESGEVWEDHQDYLWPKWITNGEVEKFNSSLGCNQYFKEH